MKYGLTLLLSLMAFSANAAIISPLMFNGYEGYEYTPSNGATEFQVKLFAGTDTKFTNQLHKEYKTSFGLVTDELGTWSTGINANLAAGDYWLILKQPAWFLSIAAVVREASANALAFAGSGTPLSIQSHTGTDGAVLAAAPTQIVKPVTVATPVPAAPSVPAVTTVAVEVPEPSSLALFGLGALVLAFRRKIAA